MFLNRVVLSTFFVLSCSLITVSTPVNITKSNFKTEVLRSELPVILAAFSLRKDWNNSNPIYKHLAQERSIERQKIACKLLLPIFKELAEDAALQQKYKFALLDVDQETDLALNMLIINVIPTFELFKNGKSLGGFDSLELRTTDKEKLKALFKKYLAELN